MHAQVGAAVPPTLQRHPLGALQLGDAFAPRPAQVGRLAGEVHPGRRLGAQLERAVAAVAHRGGHDADPVERLPLEVAGDLQAAAGGVELDVLHRRLEADQAAALDGGPLGQFAGEVEVDPAVAAAAQGLVLGVAPAVGADGQRSAVARDRTHPEGLGGREVDGGHRLGAVVEREREAQRGPDAGR
ncbi:MAG: hypothetical protein KC620_13415, partial [Myxococcales bacterium]|nr:hypothetical protein [Myxococcales bacterium]